MTHQEAVGIARKAHKALEDAGAFSHVSPCRNASFHVFADVGTITVEVFPVSKHNPDCKIRLRLADSYFDRSTTFNAMRCFDIVAAVQAEVVYYRAKLAQHSAAMAADAKSRTERAAVVDAVEVLLYKHGALATIKVTALNPNKIRLCGSNVVVECTPEKAENMIRAMLA